jgi:hypothetical protein
MIKKVKEFRKKHSDVTSPILQELIFFHRIKKDEDVILLSLEFLNVIEALQSGNLKDNKVSYKKSLQIRSILYNLPALDIIKNESLTDEEKFEKIINILQKNLDVDFSYLKKLDFEEFYNFVTIFKKSSLNLESAKRWTSKFIYPFNFDVLFFDLNNKKNFIIDRRFFTRGGEVLYLMISRGKNFEKLKELLFSTYLKNRRISLLFNKLEKENSRTNPSNLGYLPKKRSEIFDNLVDDLIKIFKKDIPLNDKFIYMSLINGFYFVHFLLNESLSYAKKSISKDNKIVYVVEVLNNKSDHLRKASRIVYKFNEKLIVEALKSEFEKISNENLKEFNLEKKDFSVIEKKAKDELIPIHRILLKPSLASTKDTNSYRYLINDLFLKTLVLINIDKRMLFNEFLDLLYEKYGFIFSNRHLNLKQSFSKNDFIKNEKRFFDRLKSLGLLENKSDGYAYVVNIFEEQK